MYSTKQHSTKSVEERTFPRTLLGWGQWEEKYYKFSLDLKFKFVGH